MDPKNNYGIWKFYANISGDERVIFSDNLELSDHEDGVDIRVSMFFDGTNNNMFNTESRLENKKKDRNEKFDKEKVAVYQEHKGDDSYENDFSNVSRLFQYYEEDITSVDSKVAAIYVEGIATLKDHGDSKSVGITGAGTWGIFDKVEDGCKQLAIRIEELKGEDKIQSLTIDVFGFSRGAAAARQFIYEITKDKIAAHYKSKPNTFSNVPIFAPEQPAFGKLDQYLTVKYDGKIKVKFAGIFDTVSSYKWIYALHLEAVGQAWDVLHLTAMDERRDQFELVDITKSKGAKFEKALPGVHTDVGGSCNGSITEKSKNLFYGSIDEIKQEISYYLQDGWFEKESDLTIHQGLGRKYISGERENVKNDYSYIPLHIMKKRATVYNKLKFTDQFNTKFKISSELDVISKRLNAYVFEKDKPMVYYTPDEIVEEIKKTVTEERIEEIRKKLHKKEKDELMNEFGFTSKSINEPIIVNNNMSKVSEIYQQRIKRDNTNIYTPTTHGYEIKFDDQAMRNALLYNYLDKDDYSEYPELQQKINDHQELKKLRKKYFHISHECSFTGGLVSIFDPYSKSIRDKPSRKIEKK